MARKQLSIVLMTLAVAACGQEPSFFDMESSDTKNKSKGGVDESGTKGPATDETAGDKEGKDDQTGEQSNPNGGANDWTPDWVDGAADGDGGSSTVPGAGEMPDVPGADDDDLGTLHKCLSQWRNHPFTGPVQNFQRISASVTVGGFGNAINDDESTNEPFLVLVDAGVNVFGAPTYQLLNKNGYYCLKVNVNVLTSLTVNLHCNARLADQRVNVNVGSTQNDTTSSVGVHVLSNVSVTTVRPEGDQCVR